MATPPRNRGFSPILAMLAVLGAGAGVLFLQAGLASTGAQREQVTQRALAQAREALLSYAADRPITPSVGPGYLPCPDLDDDGWAESICGSLAGDRGQEQRLGRLPWKTLGLPDLRDGHGERLWYAVSTRYKGLLNCAASAACVDMSPATALGTITVRDPSGAVIHDGTLADAARGGAVAVILAPGPALSRVAHRARSGAQRRECAPGECDAEGRCTTEPATRAARCDAANYLDAAPREDNADFHDRSDSGRSRNSNGFIEGPIADPAGDFWVNDRLAVITHADIVPRMARRVALEVGQCLAFYASRPENRGRLPRPEPACTTRPASAAFGRVPDTPFGGAQEHAMLERWWRAHARHPEALAELPTKAQACRIATAPFDEGTTRTVPAGTPYIEAMTAGEAEHAWWTTWKPYVFYAPAPALAPGSHGTSCEGGQGCLDWLDNDGRVIATSRRAAIVVSERPGQCATALLDCTDNRCRAVRTSSLRHEAVLAIP